MPDTNAHRLGAWIAGTPERVLPDAVADAARLCLADWLSVAIGARNEDAGRVMRTTVAGWGCDGGKGAATVLFGGRAPPAFAALANGTLAHCLDFDDTYIPAVTHTSAPVWAAVLALGEARKADARHMLAAFVTGFEVAGRLGTGLGQGLTARGMHATGVFGRIGAAAAASAMLGLDATRATHALAIAATQSSGLTASFGTMAKPFHAGKAAMDGVLSAELAANGFTGAPALLDAGGLDRALIQDGTITLPHVEPNGRAVLENSFKPYAACHLVHPAVDAARQIGVPPQQIRKVSARVAPLCMQMTGAADGDPNASLAAKFDLRYCIGLGLVGRPVSAVDFPEPWRARPEAVQVAKRVEARADASVGYASAVLDFEFADGGTRTITIATGKGHPGNAMTWDDMAMKLDGLAATVLGKGTGPLLDHAHRFGAGVEPAGLTQLLRGLPA